jgi:hypothetical protein
MIYLIKSATKDFVDVARGGELGAKFWRDE